jgi:hypothetical protein
MKSKLMIVFSLMSLFLPMAAYCDMIADFYCFSSDREGTRNFELRTFSDQPTKFSSGFVRYRNSKTMIPLVLRSTGEQTLSAGRPDELTSTWLEVNGGKISGEYEILSQGASVYSMVYTSYGTQKKSSFILDPNVTSSLEKGCQW